MAVFLHQDKPVVLLTSLKVMYSLFCHQPVLVKLCPTRLKAQTYCQRRREFAARQHIQMVRDRHARVRSFFRNYFRRGPARHLRPFAELQDCQKAFAPYLGFGPEVSAEIIQRRLLDCPFDRFMTLLPKVYALDAHLWPQFWIRRLYLGRFPVTSMEIHRVLKMERPADLAFLSEELGLDLSKLNCDPNADVDEEWSDADRAVVRRLYRKDFATFGYGFDDYWKR